MKSRLLTFALAVLTVGLLGSCSKINERIDGIDQRIGNIEQEKMASIENQIAAINSCIADLEAIRKAIADQKTAEEAIDQKINDLKTFIDTELSKYATTEWATALFATLEQLNDTKAELLALKETVTGAVDSISDAISAIETRISALEARVSALEQMIQTVTIVPAYSDGSTKAVGGVLYLDIIVEPAEAVVTLTKDSLKVLVNKVMTKAVSLDTVAITAFKSDAAKGTIIARADISSKLPADNTKSLTVALNVKNGISDFTTKFYPVFSEPKVTKKDEADTTKLTIKADADFPGPVSGDVSVADGFKESKPTTIEVEGIGTVIFDSDATSKIKANAEQAGASSVFFKVENVTATTSVKNADLVFEVTMKTVDEKGTEVYCEGKSAGEVTIQIPVDKDVIYVNSVTLVNDAGEPIEGGVVPGSEIIKDGILTFKVNHFSKYAVDYVTKTEFKAVTGVSIDPASATLEVGDTLRLAATVTPENATNKEVSWSTRDTSVVKLDNTGKITALAAGEATITVTTKDGAKTATCKVTVKAPPVVSVTGVSIDPSSVTLEVGDTLRLAATITPENATNKEVSWSSSNTAVATVGNDGKVTAVAAGTATITVTTEDGAKTATCKVKVSIPIVSVTSVSLNKTELTLEVGKDETLTATITPENATNKDVTWSSSDEAVATVGNDGKVTAVAAGTATITVTTKDGDKTATCKVTVKAPPVVSVTGVSIDPSSVTLEVGDTLRLAATVTPENATNKEVSWSSSNTAVATVGNDGKVTAVAAGTATITVTTEDGDKTATCSVTVKNEDSGTQPYNNNDNPDWFNN